MKANELRIGNYVKLMLNDEDFTIIRIMLTDLEYIEQKQGVYKPIPLTEEWLLKFGFDTDESEAIYKDVNSNCFLYFEKGIVELLENKSQVVLTKVKYVHQLQNLYWCLCGEELTINQ